MVLTLFKKEKPRISLVRVDYNTLHKNSRNMMCHIMIKILLFVLQSSPYSPDGNSVTSISSQTLNPVTIMPQTSQIMPGLTPTSEQVSQT